MLRLIPYAYTHTASFVRPDVRLRHAWYIEHKSRLGSCPDFELIDALTPKKRAMAAHHRRVGATTTFPAGWERACSSGFQRASTWPTMSGKLLAHSATPKRGIAAQPFWKHIVRVTRAAVVARAALRILEGKRESFCAEVRAAARLHDCGKLAPENQDVLGGNLRTDAADSP